MAAEDVGAASGLTHVAKGQLEVTVRTGVVVTDGVLRAAHTPDEGAGTVIRHHFGGLVHELLSNTSHVVHHVRRPVGNLFADLIHAVHALMNELFIFPTVLEDVATSCPK